MAIDRTTIIRGPATVTFDSQVMYTEDDIILRPILSRFDVGTSAYGKVDERLDDIIYEVTFTPVGKWGYATKLCPHTTPSIGSSIIGATDKNLTINTLAGRLITLNAAAVSKMPDIRFSSSKPLWGPVTFTAVGKNTTAWTDAAKRISDASAAFADTSFAPADIVTQAYTVAWGSAIPFATLQTEDGVTVSFEMSTQPVKTDLDGTVDMTLEDVQVIVRMIPVGLSETHILTLLKTQGTGVTRGASLGVLNGEILNISGTGVYFRLYEAVPVEAPFRFGRTALRTGEIAFMGAATFTTGARTPLFYLGTAAPT